MERGGYADEEGRDRTIGSGGKKRDGIRRREGAS